MSNQRTIRRIRLSEPDQSGESRQNLTEKQLDGDEMIPSYFFDYLPAELVHKILSYFTHYELGKYVAPICHRWKDCAYDPVHWKSITLDLKKSVSLTIWKKLLRRTVHLEHLVLNAADMGALPFRFCNVFSSALMHLKELHFAYFKRIEGDIFESLIHKMPSLQVLDIHGCKDVTSDCLKIICQFNNLTSLDISECSFLDDDIIHLAENIKYLKSLNIQDVYGISERSVNILLERHCQHLRHLKMGGHEELGAIKFFSRCNRLESLKLCTVFDLDDGFLFSLMELSNLEVLDLSRVRNLSRTGLCSLFEESSIKKLTSLRLCELSDVNDNVVNAICSRYGSTLLHLILLWCNLITDIGLENIVSSCRKLNCLKLAGLETITGSCLRKIPDAMPLLRFFYYTACAKIDKNVLKEVVRRKPNLEIYYLPEEDFYH